jgi:hypothetical protein
MSFTRDNIEEAIENIKDAIKDFGSVRFNLIPEMNFINIIYGSCNIMPDKLPFVSGKEAMKSF